MSITQKKIRIIFANIILFLGYIIGVRLSKSLASLTGKVTTI